MRVLVTGSRTWDDESTIRKAFGAITQFHGHELTIVHGACPTGADAIADEVARSWSGMIVEPHPADWLTYGKRAGFVRNSQMVALGADVCLAFIRDGSRGATMTADLAERHGIETRRFLA